jgi:hypothetical protein
MLRGRRAIAAVGLAAVVAGLWAIRPAPAVARSRCAADFQILAQDLPDPITAGGVTRKPDGGYYLTYSRANEWGHEGTYGMVTPDIICGPNKPEETIFSTPTEDHFGPYPGLEPGGQAYVIAFSGPASTEIEERTNDGTYDQPTVLQLDLSAVTLQRIDGSLTRLSLSIEPTSGSIFTQTIKKQDPSTWGPLLTTAFGVSVGNTGSNVRASASWTGNPSNKNETLMAWEYDLNRDGNRVIRTSIDSDYHGNTGWRHARTLIAVAGKDLSDPYVFKWKAEIRVYFVERDTSGGAGIAYMSSSDHAQTWTGPFDVPLPAPFGLGSAEITEPILAKTLDGQFPVVLLGGIQGTRGTYMLVAFEQR